MINFTPVEHEILECLASDYSIDDICLELATNSRSKIKSYLTRIRVKLGLNRMEMAVSHDFLCSFVKQLFMLTKFYNFRV